MTDELLPCPWCGAGESRIDEATQWTGMRSVVISATVRHWCERVQGHPQSVLSVSGRTREDAIAAWNRRQPAVPVAELEALRDRLDSRYSGLYVSDCADELAALIEKYKGG